MNSFRFRRRFQIPVEQKIGLRRWFIWSALLGAVAPAVWFLLFALDLLSYGPYLLLTRLWPDVDLVVADRRERALVAGVQDCERGDCVQHGALFSAGRRGMERSSLVRVNGEVMWRFRVAKSIGGLRRVSKDPVTVRE